MSQPQPSLDVGVQGVGEGDVGVRKGGTALEGHASVSDDGRVHAEGEVGRGAVESRPVLAFPSLVSLPSDTPPATGGSDGGLVDQPGE